MERKSKKIWIIGIIVLGLLAVIGITFAFFSTGGTQEQTNILNSGCLNIELTDASSSINLTNAYPITDIDGVDSTSYDFTVRNTCDTKANYSINLESLNQLSNSLNADYIKVSLSSDTFDNILSILSSNPVATPELEGSYESYSLYTASLGAHETKTYHLKLWIDYDATAKQAASKTYTSKINVVANPKTSVADALEAKFSLKSKTLTTTLSNNVTSATYCITEGNMCEPTTSATISNNSYTIELEEKETNQMVCTKLNGTSKVICSDGLSTKKIYTCKGNACESILANMTEFKTRTDFSTTVTETTTGTIYRSLDENQYDDYGETYYFAGNPTDNWVQFGTNSSDEPLYWRIIRINGDGTIRLIYNGTSTATTGTSTQIQTSTFNGSNNNAYVGYMYTSNEVHGLGTDSSIKGVLDQWYQDNLTDEAEYIEGSTGFCGDRTPSTSNSSSNGSGGTGITRTYYGAYIRLITNKTPSLECTYEDGSGIKQDLYTTSGSGQGNQALTYSIGLITADEVAMAGGVNGANNTSYYLHTGQVYWTISPSSFSGSHAIVFFVYSSGDLRAGGNVGSVIGVRPVINLKADIELTGSGTTDDPYKVV